MAAIGGRHLRWAEVTLSTDTSAYADGDVLADTQEVDDTAFDGLDTVLLLQSLVLIDTAAQSAALDIVLLNANVSLGTENATVSISDGDAASIIAVVSIADTDYVALGAGSVVAVPQFNAIVIGASAPANRTLYAGAIARGAATYAADSLKLRLGVLR